MLMFVKMETVDGTNIKNKILYLEILTKISKSKEYCFYAKNIEIKAEDIKVPYLTNVVVPNTDFRRDPKYSNWTEDSYKEGSLKHIDHMCVFDHPERIYECLKRYFKELDSYFYLEPVILIFDMKTSMNINSQVDLITRFLLEYDKDIVTIPILINFNKMKDAYFGKEEHEEFTTTPQMRILYSHFSKF